MAKRETRGPQPRAQDVKPRITGSHLDPKAIEVKPKKTGSPEVPHNAKPKLDRPRPKSRITERHETKRVI